MNFSPKVKSWIVLICTAVSSGIGSATITGASGAKIGWVLASGIGGAAIAVLHGVMGSPTDKQTISDENTKS